MVRAASCGIDSWLLCVTVCASVYLQLQRPGHAGRFGFLPGARAGGLQESFSCGMDLSRAGAIDTHQLMKAAWGLQQPGEPAEPAEPAEEEERGGEGGLLVSCLLLAQSPAPPLLRGSSSSVLRRCDWFLVQGCTAF
jgi:hypothetical protein